MDVSAQPLMAPRAVGAPGAAQAGPAAGLIAQTFLLAALATTVGISTDSWLIALTCGVMMDLVLARGLVRHHSDRFGPANWITLARATLAVAVAALVVDSFAHRAPVVLLVSIAGLGLALDLVDGWVARRTRTAAALGAWFDGEVDAFLILVLSVYVARSVGPWVLSLGAARYVFLAAGWPLPWMRRPLSPRYWRKVVAATQGIVLTIAAGEVLPPALTRTIVIAALILLAESFGRDVWQLWSERHVGGDVDSGAWDPAGMDPAAGAPAAADLASGHRERRRANVVAGLTGLAAVVVWAALVAPDQPGSLGPTAFLRIPVEGLVFIALAAVLPVTARRVLAGVAGPVLGLVVILRILDIGFFTAFARPFDPLGDLGNLTTGVETLRDSIGGTGANLLVGGAIALALVVLVTTTLALFRVTRVAAEHRRRSLATVAALSGIWLLCLASGARLLPHSPVASMSAASFVVGEVRMVQADVHDYGVFASQISHDRFGNAQGAQLLTGLRGKNVLLVFVESYGQVSVRGSSFSPAIDALLTKGNKHLRMAGFSARSAFLNAPGFGGLSWFAHSTLQSGVWANSQQRYGQLVASHRFNLTEAFNRAGWRTINFAPADDGAWPEGSSFYHYGTLYDRHNIGYRGPGFTYAPMPDQYMFEALQRLQLSKPHRRPLFAEVDTVSSHMPWNRIPRQIPWDRVGNGSIFKRVPAFREPNSFWWHPRQVKAAYARSLEYSLSVLISFIQHYGNKNLVLVVVGDEEPLPIVSGRDVSHNVPISIITRDPSVMRRTNAWGWQGGLVPSPRAPVWPMSGFRDRFLTAYGSRTDTREPAAREAVTGGQRTRATRATR